MFFILSVVFSMALCSCGNNNEQEFKNMSYIEFDGHEYVRYFNVYLGCGSMCHSPKCPCLEVYKK